jgi:hypothetical protein
MVSTRSYLCSLTYLQLETFHAKRCIHQTVLRDTTSKPFKRKVNSQNGFTYCRLIQQLNSFQLWNVYHKLYTHANRCSMLYARVLFHLYLSTLFLSHCISSFFLFQHIAHILNICNILRFSPKHFCLLFRNVCNGHYSHL